MLIIFLNKIWSYVRPHLVPMILVAAAMIAGYFFFKSEQDGLVEQMKKQQEIHNEELKKITDAQEVERKQHEINYNILEKSLAVALQKHDNQIRALEDKQSVQVSKLVQHFDSDPTGMAKELSQQTGFTLVMPEK